MTIQAPDVETPSDDLIVVDATPFQATTAATALSLHAAHSDVQANNVKTSIEEIEVGTAAARELTDQTNFLPTRQVIIVFSGLSVALACAFLDQTM